MPETQARNATDGLTKYADLFAALASPFEPFEVKQRSQAGRTFLYVTARTIMNRLDDVVGPENWWTSLRPGENGVLCEMTLRLPDGSTVTKCDVGGYAGMADQGDDEKSGASDAIKRVAVQFGISRYLYANGVPLFALSRYPALGEPPQHSGDDGYRGGGSAGGYDRLRDAAPPPRREPEARGGGNGHGEPARGPSPPQGGGQARGQGGPPRTGKALFAWSKSVEEKHDVGMVKYLNQWGKLNDFPGRMVDWDEEQVRLAYTEASRKLASLQGQGEAYEDALSN